MMPHDTHPHPGPGANTRFAVDSGVTVTLTKQPRRAALSGDPMTTGSGRLTFKGNSPIEVYPGGPGGLGFSVPR